MPREIEKTALMNYLEKLDKVYYGKVFELREIIQAWLEYIPETFPHYTRHTIRHSEEIIEQLSKFLFNDDDPTRPIVKLSAIETYILVISTYLHDIGMVISDSEKQKILSSQEWKQWTTDPGAGHKRWTQIEELRKGSVPPDEITRNFLADIQVRFLVAEFVRRQHHLRSRRIIEVHQHALGRFAFDDPVLLRTVANVCGAHCVTQKGLDDNHLYPDRCDIRDEKANVRFLAILLRIGDLLDTSMDRACPLLLNAASPLPAESFAHWSKYQRITHRMTAPDRIELHAECCTQDEHRFLQDWCQWLVEELREAAVLMSRTSRHNQWIPPHCSLEGINKTIKIKPASEATYFPSKWSFNLDKKIVFQRLMTDIYENPLAFILQLFQNALDATRCQMYLDLDNDGVDIPEYPTQVDEERRLRYPINVTLETVETLNELSGETETKQVLTVEDFGIGMDREIIERYFLQVGQSYYKTDEFRRKFRFVPNSRFGMGFLSVFAVSDFVTVETYKPSSAGSQDSIKITLRGPRNYLLTERGNRQSTGTLVKVLLRNPIDQGSLTSYLKRNCKRVEFPIVVNDLGFKQTIVAELPSQFCYDIPDLSEENARLEVKAFQINHAGIEGELYVFARIHSKGESWDMLRWAEFTYPERHPVAFSPSFPSNLICRNGITVGFHSSDPIMSRFSSYRVDVRCPLSRDGDIEPLVIDAISSKLREILREHLRTSKRSKLPDSWAYKQSLVEFFPLHSFWHSYPETIRFRIRDQVHFTSLKDILTLPIITTTLNLANPKLYLVHYYYYSHRIKVETNPKLDNGLPTLVDGDLHCLSKQHWAQIFIGRKPSNVRWLESNHLAIDWELNPNVESDLLFPPKYKQDAFELGDYISSFRFRYVSYLVEFPDSNRIALYIHGTLSNSAEAILLNRKNPFVQWLIRFRKSQLDNDHLSTKEYGRFLKTITDAICYHHNEKNYDKLQEFLDWLVNSGKIPKSLNPKQMEFNEEMFTLMPE